MKRLFLIPAVFAALSGYAQNTQCNSSDPFFKFDNAGSPKEITKLGTAPEFPFLRNMASAKQFTAAMKSNRNAEGMSHLNNMLMAIGFANGAKDVSESNVSMYYMPVGTEGNMGSAGYTSAYAVLKGDASEFKSWKITSSTGCSMYVMAKCGNAFYPKTGDRTACINVPVNINTDMKEVTLNSNAQKITTTDETYVYYHKRRHKKDAVNTNNAIADEHPSTPLLLSAKSDVQTVPETYKLTVNPATNTVNVCPDSALNLTASINVEKTAEYAGYYPKSKAEYKKISKRHYMKSEKKLRKVHRKEAKIARMTGVKVNECAVATTK